jgi:hypothetical protein
VKEAEGRGRMKQKNMEEINSSNFLFNHSTVKETEA